MFDSVSSCRHSFWLLVNSSFNGIQYLFMLPTTDATIYTGGTSGFH
jgi:hypothetical protein